MCLVLGAAFLAPPEASWGQKASNWRTYKMADGLPESTCISVTLAPNGNVLVRHLNQNSISVLDGYRIKTLPAPDTGKGRVYESPGGQLWTVVREGLEVFENGEWVLHPVPEIAAEFQSGVPRPSDPIPLCPIRQGVVLILLPNRFLEFDAVISNRDATRELGNSLNKKIGRFTGLALGGDGSLWVAGERGLARVPRPPKPDSEWEQFLPPAELGIHNLQALRGTANGGVTAVAEAGPTRRKVIVHFDGQQWAAQPPGGADRVRLGWIGPDQAWWSATSETLFEREPGVSEMAENEEIAARRYYDVAVEPGGAFWLATSDGLFRYALLNWRTPAPLKNLTSPVHCLTGDSDGRLWFATAGGLRELREDRSREFPFPQSVAQTSPAVRSLHALRNGSLVLETGGQLIGFQPTNGLYGMISPAGSDRRQFKVLGALSDGGLCVQSFATNASGRDYRLEVYDGADLKTFSNPLPEPYLHNELACVFVSQDGSLYFGSERGIAWFRDRQWRTFDSAENGGPDSVVGFTELSDGKIWCATQDRILEFDGHNWSAARSGFDRINGLLRTHDGSVWVASNSGLQRFFRGVWMENGVEEGLPSARVRGICEDQRGRLWAGTVRGLSQFHPEADLDAPDADLQRLPGDPYRPSASRTVFLAFSGQDKWKFTPRDRLLYSYRLDEQDWSMFSDLATVSCADLPAGKHYFQVRAMDRNFNITGQGRHDPKPARLEFSVVLPWYKETRLVLICLVALATALFFAGVAYNRHRQLVRSYAEVEQKVAQRTRELEAANRELLQSQKMIALGTLAAGVAHDFNNILSIVKGSAQIIEDNLESPDKVRVRLNRIKTVVEQGAGVVKAMLGFSRESDPDSSPCDINEVVNNAVRLLGDQFLREVRIRFNRAPNLPAVSVPPDFVQQILLNFFLNAAESMAGRKEIIVSTWQTNKPPATTALAPAQTAFCICISVRDFGSGIAPANMPRIFEPFFTTKSLSARRGTGLGLSMVYELARKMKAGLGVDSTPGVGSTFTLILPLQEAPVREASAKESALKSTP
jgi:signal transduction histidine kinase